MKEVTTEICKLVILWPLYKIHTNWVVCVICRYFIVCKLGMSISFKLNVGKGTNKYSFSAIKFSSSLSKTNRGNNYRTCQPEMIFDELLFFFFYQFIWATVLLTFHRTCIFFSMGIWVLVRGNHQLGISPWSFCCAIHEPINLQDSSVVYGVPCCWCTEW